MNKLFYLILGMAKEKGVRSDHLYYLFDESIFSMMPGYPDEQAFDEGTIFELEIRIHFDNYVYVEPIFMGEPIGGHLISNTETIDMESIVDFINEFNWEIDEST